MMQQKWLKIAIWSVFRLTAQSLAATDLPHRVVHQFPAGIWLENIAVRPNGNLLLTTLTPNASIYEVVNPDSQNPSVNMLFTIPSVNGLLGIAETAPDSFAFVGGNFTPTSGIQGTWGLFTTQFLPNSQPRPTFVTGLPDARLLNGMSSVAGHPELALAADSTNGLVYRVNLLSKAVQISQDYPEMKPDPASGLPIGINGVHMHGGYLYFTNFPHHTFYRIRVNPDATTALGAKVETVAVVNSSLADDFAFGPLMSNTAWITTNAGSSLVAVAPNGQMETVAGSSDASAVPADTSCAFGRKATDMNVLYVATAGSGGQGGKIEAVDTTRLSF